MEMSCAEAERRQFTYMLLPYIALGQEMPSLHCRDVWIQVSLDIYRC